MTDFPKYPVLRTIEKAKSPRRLHLAMEKALKTATTPGEQMILEKLRRVQQQYLIRLLIDQIEYSPLPAHHGSGALTAALDTIEALEIHAFPRLTKALTRAIEIRGQRLPPSDGLPWNALAKVAQANGPIVRKKAVAAAREAAGTPPSMRFDEALREAERMADRSAIHWMIATRERKAVTDPDSAPYVSSWEEKSLARSNLPLYPDLQWEVERLNRDRGEAWAKVILQSIDLMEAEPIPAESLQEWIERMHRQGPIADYPTVIRRMHQLMAAIAPESVNGDVDGPTIWMAPAGRSVDIGDVCVVEGHRKKVVGIGLTVHATEADLRRYGEHLQPAIDKPVRYVFLQRLSEAESHAMDEADRALEAWISRAMHAMA